MEPLPKPRRPWIAALFSLIVPGLGQLYDGRPRRALAIYAAPVLLLLTLLLIGLPRTFPGFVILLALVVFFRLWAAWDAAAIARRSPEYRPRPFNRWYVYLGILIIIYILPAEELLGWRPLPIRSFAIPSVSMEPAIRQGDRIVAEMRYARSARPERGDLVIYVLPDAPGQRICRIIGLPGEQIEIRNQAVYIDGKPLSDPWGQHQDSLGMGMYAQRDTLPPVAIPGDSVFLLGDNRDSSNDSRFFGFVPISNLKGRPLYVYWATDKSRIGVSLR